MLCSIEKWSPVSDARLLRHRYRKHHRTEDVAHRMERVVCQPMDAGREDCDEHRGHHLSQVRPGARTRTASEDDAARVLVDQLAVAIPGCAVSDARVFERAAEATFTLMGTSAGRLYAVALVKLRRAGAPRYVGILRWMSASGRKRTSFDDLLH